MHPGPRKDWTAPTTSVTSGWWEEGTSEPGPGAYAPALTLASQHVKITVINNSLAHSSNSRKKQGLLCEVPGQLTGSEEPGILSSLWSPTAQICLFCEKEAMALDRLFLPGLVSESAPRPWGRFWNPPFDKLNWNVFKKNILPFQNSNPKIHFHSFHWNFGEGPRKKKEERKKNWFI